MDLSKNKDERCYYHPCSTEEYKVSNWTSYRIAQLDEMETKLNEQIEKNNYLKKYIDEKMRSLKNIKQTLSVSQRRKKQRASKRHYSNSYYDCYDYADGGDCD